MTGDLEQLYEGPSYRAKDKQKALIYHAVRSSPGLTRKQLAENLSLRRTTVSNLVQQLLDGGLLREGELKSSGRQGRPQISLQPNINRFMALALYFVSMELKGALINSAYQIVAEQTETLCERTDHAQLRDRIVATVQALRPHAPPDVEVLGCGITFPGYTDTLRQRWVFAARWPRLRDFSVHDLASRINLPVSCRRSLDAELEHLLRQYPAYRTGGTLLVHWGYGIGSSYAHNGEIIRTAAGGFGEIGHVSLCDSGDGSRCICGRRGCLETEAALWAILPQLRQTAPDLPHGEEAFARVLIERKLASHPVVQQAVAAFTRAMVVLYTVLAPDRIILYGPFLNSDTVFQQVIDGVYTGLSPVFANLLSVERITTGFTAGLIGSTAELFHEAYRRHLVAM